jgi:hypothetical protein
VITVLHTAVSRSNLDITNSLVASSNDGSGHSVQGFLVIALVCLLGIAIFVIKALWALLTTISEQRPSTSAGVPLILTMSMLAIFVGLIFIAYVAHGGGPA